MVQTISPPHQSSSVEQCTMLTVYGRRCEREALLSDDELADVVPMCSQHRQRLLRAAELVLQRRDRRNRRPERAARRRRTIVYFLRRADGTIKIGYTTNIDGRTSSLRSDHGPLELLATAQGGRDAERFMHAKFADARIGQTEWFRPVPALLAFIDRLAP